MRKLGREPASEDASPGRPTPFGPTGAEQRFYLLLHGKPCVARLVDWTGRPQDPLSLETGGLSVRASNDGRWSEAALPECAACEARPADAMLCASCDMPSVCTPCAHRIRATTSRCPGCAVPLGAGDPIHSVVPLPSFSASSSSDEATVFVKKDGRTAALRVQMTWSWLHVLVMLYAERKDFIIPECRLMFAGKDLQRCPTLSLAGVRPESTLFFLPRVCGD